MTEQRKAFFPLLTVVFVDALSFSIVLPILVYVVRDFGGNDIIYGLLGATYPFFQLIGSPILGNLSDKVGRRKVLIVSQAGTMLAWILFLTAFYLPKTLWFEAETGWLAGVAVTSSLVMAFISFALDGLTGGNISVAQAYLADISDERTRKRDYAKMGMAAGLGFVVGPALAGMLAAGPLGYNTPVIAAIGISMVCLGLLIFYLPNQQIAPRKAAAPPQEQENAQPRIRPLAFLRQPRIRFVLLLYFLVFLTMDIFFTAFPLYAETSLQWDATTLGYFFVVLAGLLVVVQGPLMNWLSTRTDDEPLIWVGAVILMASFLCLLGNLEWLSWLSAVLFALGDGMLSPSLLSIVARVAPKGYQGTVQGLAASAGGSASVLGLLAGGVLFNTFQAWVFVFPAAVLLVFWVCSLWLPRLRARAPVPSPEKPT